jgi:hypothetical protein
MAGAAVASALISRARDLRVAVDIMHRVRATIAQGLATIMPAEVALVTTDVAHPVAAQITRQIWEPINHEVSQHVDHLIPIPGYGQHDAPRLAFYEALAMAGLDVSELDPFMEIAQSCGWWWSFGDACVLCERASCLARDQRGELHSANGPAVMYPDGWSLYAWHGVPVQAATIVRPELITLAQIENETNPAVRHVLLTRYHDGRRRDKSRPNVVH